MMEPRIEAFTGKKLIGKRMRMSLADNKTGELWKGFMTERKEIKNSVGSDLYSAQLYDPMYFARFDPRTEFVKWAAIEVSDPADIPAGMEAVIIPPGLYAVFLYKGAASRGGEVFQYIFGTWLPASEYVLDDRLHFEILGEKYKNDHPDSEEEIWIPVKAKRNN